MRYNADRLVWQQTTPVIDQELRIYRTALIDSGKSGFMSNKRKAIDGGKWITISTVISTLLQFVQISILAKMLEPAAFGLVSISTLIINFFFTISNVGFSNSIIYKQEDDKKTLSTLYFLSILLGLAAFVIIRVGTPLAVAYYHEPGLERILNVSSYYFIVIFFGQTYLFLLQKELKFRTIAIIDILSALIGTTISVTLAMNGFREMSLIYGGLAGVILHTVLQVAVGIRSFVPQLYFDLRTIKEHLRFGMYNVGEGLLGYVQTNLDNIMIGGLLGVKALGFYTVAYQLAVFPIIKLNPIILQVAYPVLAKMKDDNQALKRAYLQILDLVSYLNLPLLAGLFVMADSVVPLIYGPGWGTSIEFIRIFVFAAFCFALHHPLFTLAFTKGKPNLLFYLNVVTMIIKVPLLYLFAHYFGQVGVAVSFLITSFITLIFSFCIVHSLVGSFLRDFLTNLSKTLLFGGIMVGAVSLYRYLDPGTDLLTVLLQISVGGIVYGLLTVLFKIPIVKVKAYLSGVNVLRS